LPEGITAERANESMIAVDPDGVAHTDAGALAQVLRSLPLTAWLGWLISLPGVSWVVAKIYYRVANNRLAISEACGLGACGLPPKPHGDAEAPEEDVPSPAAKWRRRASIGTEALLSLAVLAAIVAQ